MIDDPIPYCCGYSGIWSSFYTSIATPIIWFAAM